VSCKRKLDDARDGRRVKECRLCWATVFVEQGGVLPLMQADDWSYLLEARAIREHWESRSKEGNEIDFITLFFAKNIAGLMAFTIIPFIWVMENLMDLLFKGLERVLGKERLERGLTLPQLMAPLIVLGLALIVLAGGLK